MSDVISITRQNISAIERKCPYEMWEKIYRAVQANIDDDKYPLVKVATEIGESYGVTQEELFTLMPALERLHGKQQLKATTAAGIEAALKADEAKEWGPPIAIPPNERPNVHPPAEAEKPEDTATQPTEDTDAKAKPTA